jgi:uncharacterized protein (DUF2235 family)
VGKFGLKFNVAEFFMSKPKQRLILFFDGTWNTPENNTNVWRLNLMLADTSPDGVLQRKFYDPGVGTHWYDRLSGGAFGAGLSDNIRSGYCWLMENYDPGDEIYLFGFSRGAFTARSIAGVIARCGLLKSDAPMSYVQLYERYQKGDTVRPIYRLKYLQSRGETSFDFEERLLLDYSYYQRNFIKMVGVWDTVGSIGLPFGDIPGISRRTLRFHNTNLSKIVQHSYQALALDEQRQPYWAVLWTNFTPAKPPDPDEGPQVDNRFVEQRWFAGSHCNVGGGYRNDLLPQRPLAWLQEKARACGLAFRSSALVNDDDLGISTRDSYAEFLGGYWSYLSLFRFGRRYLRWVKSEPVKKQAHWKGTSRIEDGFVETVNERIDLSIFRRCQLYKDYRPPNLREWAGRKGFDLEKIIAAPEQYADLYAPVTKPGLEGFNSPGG